MNRDFSSQFSAFSASSCSKFLKRNGRAQGFAMKLMRHPEDLFEQEIVAVQTE
jgi:hypothetical protein